MARKNNTMFAIIGILTRGPQTGYDIRKQFTESLRYFWSESYGQIYPMLKEAVSKGYAEMRVTGHPRQKKVYSLTDEGREVFRSWLSEPVNPINYRDELLLKVSFAGMEEDEVIMGLLRQEKMELQQRLDILKLQEEDLKAASETREFPTWLLTLRYGIVSTEARLSWCREALQLLGGRVGR
ncbi:PadR family transcriptional regulator [Paenibacillus tarimensis]|uniref:PadR family transcriptional regulator n=1 Tax=Paenibacillus tarimensis TaxID=416012 RepID=UPI001F2C557A|nr:PadR family transcriptional regulator [Paenibacillus tarimensis]MCF2945709.1 PadR family transcriptional regulator [Paenibacillus tarimensis]